MKRYFALFAFLLSFAAHADIYAQSGYKDGQDGILLLTTKCKGEEEFKIAFIKVNSTMMDGCYIENNRGNFIVKWSNGEIAELPANIFNIQKKKTATSVSTGYYIRLFSGRKQGGPNRHKDVVEILEEASVLKPYQFICIAGPDFTKANFFDIEKYNTKHPFLKVSLQCKGSSYILVGPFSDESELRTFSSENKIEKYDMHLYKDLVYCEKLCKELPR